MAEAPEVSASGKEGKVPAENGSVTVEALTIDGVISSVQPRNDSPRYHGQSMLRILPKLPLGDIQHPSPILNLALYCATVREQRLTLLQLDTHLPSFEVELANYNQLHAPLFHVHILNGLASLHVPKELNCPYQSYPGVVPVVVEEDEPRVEC